MKGGRIGRASLLHRGGLRVTVRIYLLTLGLIVFYSSFNHVLFSFFYVFALTLLQFFFFCFLFGFLLETWDVRDAYEVASLSARLGGCWIWSKFWRNVIACNAAGRWACISYTFHVFFLLSWSEVKIKLITTVSFFFTPTSLGRWKSELQSGKFWQSMQIVCFLLSTFGLLFPLYFCLELVKKKKVPNLNLKACLTNKEGKKAW